MANYILNPGDVITVAENPSGCLGAIVVGAIILTGICGGFSDKKSTNSQELQIKQQIHQRTQEKQEYIIDPDAIKGNYKSNPSSNSFDYFIDPDEIKRNYKSNYTK